jgi:hypothetical protein
MSTENSEPASNRDLAAYEAVRQHWAHAEQERWQILYNFLTANSILVLAWAAIFASQTPYKSLVLIGLSVAGIIMSVLWLVIEARVNIFIKGYGKLGEDIEKKLLLDKSGPFHLGQIIRGEERPVAEKGNGEHDLIWRIVGFIPSRFFVIGIPGLFAAGYFVLFVFSWPATLFHCLFHNLR